MSSSKRSSERFGDCSLMRLFVLKLETPAFLSLNSADISSRFSRWLANTGFRFRKRRWIKKLKEQRLLKGFTLGPLQDHVDKLLRLRKPSKPTEDPLSLNDVDLRNSENDLLKEEEAVKVLKRSRAYPNKASTALSSSLVEM